MAIRNAEQEVLFRVGPGTPSGEVFRRYWLPVETSSNLGGGRGPVGQGGGIDPNRVDDAFKSVQDYVRKKLTS